MSTEESTAPDSTLEADIDGLVARLRTTVEQARAMPMSSSAVIGRGEVLDLVDRIESAVAHLKSERATGTGLNATVAEAKAAADKVLADAHEKRRQLLEGTSVLSAAESEAERIRRDAREEADGLRRDTDEYVDGKLASFEIALNKTLEAVSRGRARLRGRSDLDELGTDDLDAIHLPEH
jgi:cell division septum initiation protein DivIVA